MSAVPADLVVIGRITAVYGIKGWLKVYSYTEPMQNLLTYRSCQIQRQGQWQLIEIEEGRAHGKGIVLKLRNIDDRDVAATYVGCDIGAPLAQLPALEEGEYYWRQLEGLLVFVDHPERGRLLLGRVDHLLETGANDVLVVKGNEDSIDRQERLVPYLPEQVVLNIDLTTQTMIVDWDPDF